jgi:acyl-coenzyme A thioesterase PaaI-like protein
VTTNTSAHPGSMVAPADCVVPDRPSDAPAPGTLLRSHFTACIGCGVDHPAGLRMQITAGEGLTVHGRFAVTDDHQGAPGLAHGGLVATAMDEVLGGLGWLLRTPMVTGRLQGEYLRPVPVGTSLWLHAQVDGVAGRRIFCQGRAHAEGPDGDLLARAFAVFVAVPLEHFRTHGRADVIDAAVRAAGTTPSVSPWAVNP